MDRLLFAMLNALLVKTLLQLGSSVPPGDRLAELLNETGIKPHRSADIANSTAGSVGNDSGCKSRSTT